MTSLLRVTGLFLALSASCSSSFAEDVPTAVYKCEDGSQFSARFENETAQLTFPDGTAYVLPVAISGSGFHYEAGGRKLRGKGDDATWTVPGAEPLNCRAEDAD